MIAAIVIPIIILYFYVITRREWKLQNQNWLSIDQVREEAVVIGTVLSITKEKQRFYYNKHLYVIQIMIRTNNKSIYAEKRIPITSSLELPTISIGDKIKCIGQWEKNSFRFSHFDIITENT